MRMRSLVVIACAMAIPSIASAQDANRGKQVFAECEACHSFDPDKSEVGPHLKGLFGRHSASVDGFTYSPAMRRANVVWTPQLLDTFLADPQAAPFRGNRMPFSGMSDPQARADLIAYLQAASK